MNLAHRCRGSGGVADLVSSWGAERDLGHLGTFGVSEGHLARIRRCGTMNTRVVKKTRSLRRGGTVRFSRYEATER